MLAVLAIVLVAAISGYLFFAAPNLSSTTMAFLVPVLLAFVIVTLLLLARQAGRWRREYTLDDQTDNDAAHGKRASSLGMARGRNVYFKR
jgi:hypothetical protein